MSNTPEIRFSFDKDWQIKSLSSICNDIKTGKLDANAATKSGKYKFFTCSKEDYKTDSYEFDGDAVIINGNGDLGITKVFSGKFNAYQRTYVLMNFNEDYKYIGHTIPYYLPNKIKKEAIGGAMPYIKIDTLNELMLGIPEIPEQKQIASFLSNVDSLIDSKKNELEKTKQYKATMLYKMFPQDGKLVPEIRFKDFDGDWNCSMFDKSFIKLNNNSFSRDQLNYRTGEFKNIHYGDILINFSFIVKYENKIVPFLNNNQKVRVKETDYLKTGDIVFADTAEDTTAGKMVEILNPNNGKLISGMHTYACRPLLKFETGYLGIYMNTIQFHSQLLPYMQGTKVTSFNYDYLGRTKVKYPKFEEQKRIINFFTNLDSMISNQENEIEILEHMKATLLSKMFA